MGAGQNGTGARSSFGFGGRVSETGTRKERAAAGGNLVEGDPSVSSRTPQASVQAAQSIARGDSQLSEAESTGARDSNVPEKETAAVRRDGEPLMNAAKRRRQTESETDAEEPQTDAGEWPPSPVREDEEEPPPLAEDPAGQQARLAAIEEQLASIAAQPRVLWLPIVSAETQTEGLQRSGWRLHRCNWCLQRWTWCPQRQTWCLRERGQQTQHARGHLQR